MKSLFFTREKDIIFLLASCFCNPMRLSVLSLILLFSQEFLQLNVIHKIEQCTI